MRTEVSHPLSLLVDSMEDQALVPEYYSEQRLLHGIIAVKEKLVLDVTLNIHIRKRTSYNSIESIHH